jgi:hypothetical protein
MRSRSLFKYYGDRRWAEAFLDGSLMFRSLAYFRDYEDRNVRGDRNEGTSIFRPAGGLTIHNHTQARSFTMPQHGMTSTADQQEIFVFCLSRSLNEHLRERFEAAVCVEIMNLSVLSSRVTAALPATATFPGRPGHTRIGQRVEYYKEEDSANPRWALPDMIASSKLDGYAWQGEFRLIFSLTGALGFERVDMKLVHRDTPAPPPNPAEHRHHLVQTACLSDICRLHEFPPRA